MEYMFIEIVEGSLSGARVAGTTQEAVNWANEVVKEYDWDLDGLSRRPDITMDDLMAEDLDIELPGDEMNQSHLHIISKKTL